MQELRRWKPVKVLRLYAWYTSHASFASRGGKHVSHLMWTCQLIQTLYRGGMGRFSSRRRSKASVFAINLVILGNPALVLRQAPRTSLYSTSRAHIILQSTTVNAATNPCRIGSNYCARNGFQPHFHAHKRFSPSTASKHSTNSLYKEKQACTTTSTPFSDYQIMPTFPLQS